MQPRPISFSAEPLSLTQAPMDFNIDFLIFLFQPVATGLVMW
jgi:hypothetical protein